MNVYGYIHGFMYKSVVCMNSVVKIGLLLTFLHSWVRIQLSCLANSFTTCPSTFLASETLWLWFSLSFCALEFML